MWYLHWMLRFICCKKRKYLGRTADPLSVDIQQKKSVTTNAASAMSPRRVGWEIFSAIVFNFIVYFLIGLPLAVFPGFVHFTLGFSAVLAGFLISLQYAATLVTRALIGRLSDVKGPKSAVLTGLACAIASGACVFVASRSGSAEAVLAWLSFSRIWLGAAESGTGTGCVTWAIGRIGPAHMAEAISLSGVAAYGGIALGAPAGVYLNHLGGLGALGLVTMGLAFTGLLLSAFKPAAQIVTGARMRFASVFRRMLPYGAALALGSVAFGTIVAFITLYYASHGWSGAAYALSAFSVAFVFVRAFFTRAVLRFGGFSAAKVSFSIEAVGLLALWLAPAPWVAMLGVILTGLGLSLIFPAMAMEALKTVSQSNRGAAIGVYTVFLDLSLGVTGPLAGLLITHYGYPSVYLMAAVAVVCALLLVFRLSALARSVP